MTPSYALGLVFIFLVSIIWSFASVVVQYLYQDMHFRSPFLLTYVGTSLFVVLIPSRLVWERRMIICRWCVGCCRRGGWKKIRDEEGGEDEEEEEGIVITPWRNEHDHYQDVPSVASTYDTGSLNSGIGGIDSNQPSPLPSRFKGRVGKGVGLEEAAGSTVAAGSSSALRGLASADESRAASMSGGHVGNVQQPRRMSLERTLDGITMSGGGEMAPVAAEACLLHSDPATETSSNAIIGTLTSHQSSYNLDSDENDDDDAIGADCGGCCKGGPLQQQPQRNPPHHHHPDHVLSHVDHIAIAARIAPAWFVSNYLYNTSLAFTSITSSTVLASTGSLFTFLFAVVWGDEAFTTMKLWGVLFCVLGSVLTGLTDASSTSENGSTDEAGAASGGGDGDTTGVGTVTDSYGERVLTPPHMSQGWHEEHQLWGDVAGLLSAAGYGTYTVLIRTLCPKNEDRMSMQLLLGYIGLMNMIVLSPVALKLLLFPGGGGDGAKEEDDGAEREEDFVAQPTLSALQQPSSHDDISTTTTPSAQEQITWVIFFYLVMKGLLDNVLSDYLWARAVVLTSATVATVGLGLTIPLAFVGDWIMGREDVFGNWGSVVGALAVLSGFVFVNVDGAKEEEEEEDG